MTLPALVAPAPGPRFRAAWLFSPQRDLVIVVAPVLATLAAAALGAWLGVDGILARSYAAWASQFVLGNSTHVILTFVLLASRRDVLRATDRQAKVVAGGSLLVFLFAFAGLFTLDRISPPVGDFAFAVLMIFATHHALAQVKGFWALHNLRSARAGLAAPAPRERWMQQHWVAIALLFVMTRWLLVAKSPSSPFPYLESVAALPAPLPYEASYVLMGGFAFYLAVLAWEIGRAPSVSTSKLLYLSLHGATVMLMLFAPGWGAVLSASIHGVEYFVLCGRMLEPLPSDPPSRVGRSLVWPIMIAAAFPLFAIGVVNAPFTGLFASPSATVVFRVLRNILNAVVLAHYFADAFIYRFRVPEIRRVALARLGFA